MVTRVTAQAVGKKVAQKVQKNVTRAVSGTLGLSGERMSKVDTAWLRMDCDANLMMIVGVWQLSPGVKYAAVCERIENSLLKYHRFKQRVMEDAAGATWVNDRNFDLANHVVLEKLPKAHNQNGGQQDALQDRVAALATQRLDQSEYTTSALKAVNANSANNVPICSLKAAFGATKHPK